MNEQDLVRKLRQIPMGMPSDVTPSTEAGRKLLNSWIGNEMAYPTVGGAGVPKITPIADTILAIEAEAQSNSLDAAWREAEAALTEGWMLLELRRLRVGADLDLIVWEACAGPEDSGGPVLPRRVTAMSYPAAAALRALAEKLRGEG